MSSKMLVIFCLLFTVLESVFGATCTNSATCVVSTHTTGSCDSTSKVCTCDSSSAAIRTGCGSKLTKPNIVQPPGYSTVVLEGKNATLICSSPDGATLFEWTFNGTVIRGANVTTYTIAAALTSDIGIYKCKAKVSENSNLDSDLSDPLQIDIFLKTDKTISNGPTIFVPTTTVFNGKSVTISCINIPIGYDTAKVEILRETSTFSWDNTPTYELPQEEGSYTIKCWADTPTIGLVSHRITIVRNSSYVTKPVIIADSTTPVVGSRLSLTCGSAVDGAKYSWKKDNTSIARQFEHIIQLDNLTISDNGTYECTVQRSMVTQTSDSFTVNVSDAPPKTCPIRKPNRNFIDKTKVV